MADSVQNKRNQQTYLRQIQQDKALRKRELITAQNQDIKSVRNYYADQAKQLETETAAAVNHIKEESRQMAATEKQERVQRLEYQAEQKRLERDEIAASRSQNSSQSTAGQSATQSSEKKNFIA